MTSKKSFFTLTCVLFASLCSPIKAETTNKERIFRALNDGICGFLPAFVIASANKRTRDTFSRDTFSRDTFSRDVSFKVLIYAVFTGAICNAIIDEFGDLFSESNRHLLGKKRFLGNVAQGGGTIVGGLIGMWLDKEGSDNFYFQSFATIGSVAGGGAARYFLEKREKNIFQELEQKKIRKNVKSAMLPNCRKIKRHKKYKKM